MFLRTDKKLKKQFPDEPWKWHPQWAKGEIKTDTLSGAVALTVFALIWNTISWAITIAVLPGILAEKKYPALFVLLFPAAGALLILWTFNLWKTHLRMGKTCLILDTIPGVIGGQLSGRVKMPQLMMAKGEPIDVTLTCVYVYSSGSGKNSSTHHKAVWQSQFSTPLQGDRQGAWLPVSFTIPFECPEADLKMTLPRHEWKLALTGRVGKRKIDIGFLVPVYKTPDSSEEITQAQVTKEELNRHAIDLDAAKFKVQSNAQGDLRITVPSLLKRSPGGGVGLVVFLLAWTVAIGLMITLGAPILLVVVFFVFDLILILALGNMIFSGTVALVTPEDIRVKRTILFFTREKRARTEDVKRIVTHQGMTAQNSGGTPKIYYDLNIETTAEKSFTIIKSSLEKAELDYLGDLIREKMGVR